MNSKFRTWFLVLFIVHGCAAPESLTPMEVLAKVQKAFYEKNGDTFLLYLSNNFINRMQVHVDEIRKSFSVLPKDALKGLALKMGIPVSRISQMNLEEYIQYRMEHGKFVLGSDYLLFPMEALEPVNVTNRLEADEKTTLIFKNGAKLIFIKEENLWKIEKYIDAKYDDLFEVIQK
ncbi:MAG: hypothetical protein ABUK01_10550 [Leptospirales bacterium]